MSDTILQSNDVMDSHRGDIVADRTAGECGLRMDPFMGYGIPAGR